MGCDPNKIEKANRMTFPSRVVTGPFYFDGPGMLFFDGVQAGRLYISPIDPSPAANPDAFGYSLPRNGFIPRKGQYWFYYDAPAEGTFVFIKMCLSPAIMLGDDTVVVVLTQTLGYVHKVFADSPYPYNAVTDYTVEWDATLGASILQLPAVAPGNLGQVFVAKLDPVDVSGNGLAVTPAGADTIDRVPLATVLVVPGAQLMLQSDGVSNWCVIA